MIDAKGIVNTYTEEQIKERAIIFRGFCGLMKDAHKMEIEELNKALEIKKLRKYTVNA